PGRWLLTWVLRRVAQARTSIAHIRDTPVSTIWKIGPPLFTTRSSYRGGDRSVDCKWPWRTPIATRLTIPPVARTAIWLTLLIPWRTEQAPISINGISSISATFGTYHSL